MINKQNSKTYKWGKNCDSWVFVDTEDLSVKVESMPHGAKEKLHFHSRAKQFFYILKGEATFYLNGIIEIVNENEGVLIDPKIEHYIANETEDLLDFIVISQPTTNNDRTTLK